VGQRLEAIGQFGSSGDTSELVRILSTLPTRRSSFSLETTVCRSQHRLHQGRAFGRARATGSLHGREKLDWWWAERSCTTVLAGSGGSRRRRRLARARAVNFD